MDSVVEVALAAKLRKLFPPEEDKFMAFPMTGLAFAREELDFLKDSGGLSAEQVRQQMLYKSQFARILNRIPVDDVVYSSRDSLLWSEYSRILNSAKLAKSLLSPEEQEELKKADDFLMQTKTIDGVETLVYSQALENYYAYREAYQEAERTYLDEELTVQNSNDPALKKDWDSRREKQLKDVKEKAYNDWTNLGRKADVEHWQNVKRRLSSRIPGTFVQQYINDLKACYEPDLITNDPVGTYSTFYSPSNCFDPKLPWTKLHLDRKEIIALVNSAPEELKRFATTTKIGIDSLTMEYMKVVIMRPWFEPSFFNSNYWKLPQDQTIVSDGLIPRGGSIPAFVTNMIVTRNIEVTYKKTTSKKRVAPNLRFIAPALLQVKHRLTTKVGKKKSTATSKGIAPRVLKVSLPQKPSPSVTTARRNRKPVRAAPSVAFLRAKIRGTCVKRKPLLVPSLNMIKMARKRVNAKKKKKKAPPKVQTVVEKLDLEGIAVLAFVCRRVPKSPVPNANLSWM